MKPNPTAGILSPSGSCPHGTTSVQVVRSHKLSLGLLCVPSTVGSGRRQNTILVKVPGPEESQEDQDSGSEASDSVSNSGNTSNTQNGQTVTLITLNSEGMSNARKGTRAHAHKNTTNQAHTQEHMDDRSTCARTCTRTHARTHRRMHARTRAHTRTQPQEHTHKGCNGVRCYGKP